MDDERGAVKAKSNAVDGLKKGIPKIRCKETVEKDVHARGLKRSDAQEHAVWRLYRLQKPVHFSSLKNQTGFQKKEAYCQHLETNG